MPRAVNLNKMMRRRPGRMNAAWLVFLASIAAMAVLIGLLVVGRNGPSSASTQPSEPLLVYCAAGIKAPVEAVAKAYEREFGVRIELQYGASATLLANVQASGRGDLYLPADESYIQVAREKHCAFADVYHLWMQITGKKKPEDLLGNNINHPNDFGHWIYFQALQAVGL